MKDETAKTIMELKTLNQEMILEIAALKERIVRLEEDRAAATAASSPPPNNEPALRDAAAVREAYMAMRGEGYEHLGALYNEGYHVCHPAFAQARADECLFCIALLNKE